MSTAIDRITGYVVETLDGSGIGRGHSIQGKAGGIVAAIGGDTLTVYHSFDNETFYPLTDEGSAVTIVVPNGGVEPIPEVAMLAPFIQFRGAASKVVHVAFKS